MSLLDVAVQALKSKATSAVALVGILPIYAAVGMGIVIFEAPESVRIGAYWLGLILPFIAGLWGRPRCITASRRCATRCHSNVVGNERVSCDGSWRLGPRATRRFLQ